MRPDEAKSMGRLLGTDQYIEAQADVTREHLGMCDRIRVRTITGPKVVVPWWRDDCWFTPATKDAAIERIKSQPYFNPTTTRKP